MTATGGCFNPSPTSPRRGGDTGATGSGKTAAAFAPAPAASGAGDWCGRAALERTRSSEPKRLLSRLSQLVDLSSYRYCFFQLFNR